MNRRVLCVVALVALPTRTWAQTTPIFESDIRAAAAPDYGFDGSVDDCGAGTNCTLSRLAGASPSGNDAIRLVATATGDAAQFDVYWFNDDNSMPAVTQGQTRYVRWRYRFNSPIYWPSNQGGVNARSAGGKAFIIGNSCNEEEGRVIASLGTNAPNRNDPFVELDRNIDGLNIVAPNLTADTWHSIQIAMVSSSTSVATDGALRLYVDTNTVGSPTDSASGFALPSATWGSSALDCGLIWGFSAFNELALTGTFSVDFADFEYDDEFDPNWHGGGGGDGTTYYRFRFRASANPAPWGLVAWTDRRRRGVMA